MVYLSLARRSRSTASGRDLPWEREGGGGIPHDAVVLLGNERVVSGVGRVVDRVVRRGGQLVEHAVQYGGCNTEAGPPIPTWILHTILPWGSPDMGLQCVFNK